MPILAFITSPLGKLAGVLLAIMAIYFAGMHKGAENVRADDLQKLKVAQERIVNIEARAARISSRAEKAHATDVAQIHNVTRTVIQRIPAHVAPSDPHFYPLPAYFVQLHNASLGLPDVSASPGKPDAEASGLGAADALPVIVSNYGICRETAAQLEGLQGWIRAQAANR